MYIFPPFVARYSVLLQQKHNNSTVNMKATIIFCIMALQSLTSTSSTTCYSSLRDGFNHPQDSARTKVWWFYGNETDSRRGRQN